MTAMNTPGLLIVIDPGTSLIKAIYTGRSGKPEPLALPPELVRSVTPAQAEAQLAEYEDDPLRSAFVEVNGTLYAAGDFALDLAGRQYHELSKWNDLTPRLLTILGLVCIELGFSDGCNATIGLLLPRDELNPPERDAKLSAIQQAARNFKFRGVPLSCELHFRIVAEGSGLFAPHAASLQSQGLNPARLDIPVVMGGERNTSLLTYRAGKINPAYSASDGDGFYKFAMQLKKAVGGNITLPELIKAVANKRDRVRTVGNEVINLAPHLPKVLEAYAGSVTNYLQAKLPPGDIHVVCGGGGLGLIWNQLEQWFREAEIPAVFVGKHLTNELNQIFSNRPDFDPTASPEQILRFADALGFYKAMLGRLQREQQQLEQISMETGMVLVTARKGN
ncbi:hypothetical protein K9N68_30640 [Kovacikia minuta CCNUW1]|uniref:hypothetical protein n=1 Tax=Kovacikia minuta TaxID=2931930 RepID=UPI001CCC4B4A|nr:hypothetical protein [Kovacikia minuta]UBF25853.1 hypothetical protein K9N68_30640 [Kovacikia minuta CCNUW1]